MQSRAESRIESQPPTRKGGHPLRSLSSSAAHERRSKEESTMLRARLITSLLPLAFLLEASASTVPAPGAPPSGWQPGTYLGRITIAANVDYVESPLAEGTVKAEYHLRLRESTGRMQAQVGPKGTIAIRFSVPGEYTYSDWAEVRDDGQGNCRGQVSEATGHGTVRLVSPSSLAPAGDKFSATSLARFSLAAFSWKLRQLGSNCPEDAYTPKVMRSAHEAAFHMMFENALMFEVWSPTSTSMAGVCDLPGWQTDPDHIFVCTWFVQRLPTK
jgi:hypothetical protein